jgi:quercetin dioxygenase-like cupin family protein
VGIATSTLGGAILARDLGLQEVNMDQARIFKSTDFFQPSVGDPIRSVVTESPEAVVVAWHVNPGQRIAAHTHPNGQDTWTILSGQGDYQMLPSGESRRIVAGDVVVAHTGSVHGVFNCGMEPLRFISVVGPATAGYELIEDEHVG